MSRPSVVVLDGGLSNALADRGHDLTGDLWTARLLRDAPEEIAAVHRAYFAAGARVATTASYQASIEGFTALGVSRAEAEALIGRSVLLARKVRDDLAADGIERFVAASVGPYGAALADGSEYRGRYGLAAARLRDFHRPRLELLAAAGPDLIAVETIPDVDEAAVLVELLDEIGVPVWFSFSADGLKTRAGQPLDEAFLVAASARSVVAVGVNCCAPADVLPAVRLVVETTGLPAVAYPNRGESWDPIRHAWTGPGGFDPNLGTAWIDAGAQYVGGCCRVGLNGIAALADTVLGSPDRASHVAG
jgi:homocysteine S-methyltransferase